MPTAGDPGVEGRRGQGLHLFLHAVLLLVSFKVFTVIEMGTASKSMASQKIVCMLDKVLFSARLAQSRLIRAVRPFSNDRGHRICCSRGGHLQLLPDSSQGSVHHVQS